MIDPLMFVHLFFYPFIAGVLFVACISLCKQALDSIDDTDALDIVIIGVAVAVWFGWLLLTFAALNNYARYMY